MLVLADRPGPFYAEAFAEKLQEQMKLRGVSGRTFTRNHPENDESLFSRARKGGKGLAIIRPVFGLQQSDAFVQRAYVEIHYEVEVLVPVDGEERSTWGAYVSAKSGYAKRMWRKRFLEVATELVGWLIRDGVVQARGPA